MCNQFTWFGKFSEALRLLDDEAERNAIIVAIVDYGAEGIEPEGLPTPASRALFAMMRDDIDNSVKARSSNRGGRPKQGASPKAKQGVSETQEQGVSETAKQGVSEAQEQGVSPKSKQGVSEEGKPNTSQYKTIQSSTDQGREGAQAPRSTPPSLAEVEAFVAENGLSGTDPAAFHDFYTANGWVQSRGKPIRDWRAACRNWDRRQGEFGGKAAKGGDSVADFGEYADAF